VEIAPSTEHPTFFLQGLLGVGGFWRGRVCLHSPSDVECSAPHVPELLECLISSAEPEGFHPWGNSSGFCHFAVIQVIGSEETQKKPSDKYTKDIDSTPSTHAKASTHI